MTVEDEKGRTGAGGARDALARLARGHGDRALRAQAYRFAVALDWQRADGSVVDTVTLRSWDERGASLDPDTAADQFVEAVETVLARELPSHLGGGLRSRALGGLARISGRRSGRAERVERLLRAAREAAGGSEALAAYADYQAALADQVPRWLAACRLALRLEAAWRER